MLRFGGFSLMTLWIVGCGSATARPSSPERAPVDIASVPEAPRELHLGRVAWELDDEHCQSVILPQQALPRDPSPCLNVDLHAGVSAALLREVDLAAAQVPVMLSIEPGVVFPDVTMHHVVALRVGGGHYDAAPLPPRSLFPAVRHLATHRSTVLPDSGWLEADEVLLGLTLVDDDSLTAMQSVALRVVALEVATTSIADRQADLARLTNLTDVRMAGSANNLNALPPTVTHLALQGADDSLLPLLQRFPRLRSLSLLGARLESLGPLAGLDLTHLSLRQARLGEDALAELPGFPNLVRLDLYDASNVDERIDLSTMRSLEVLEFWDAELEDTSFLAELSKLQVLSLGKTEITDEDVAVLSGLASLRSLSLRANRITGAVLRALPREITDLDLGHTSVSDVCPHITRLTALRTLDLSFTGVSDTSCFPQLANLETLSLAATRVSDSSMPAISQLRQLRDLSLMTTALADAGFAELTALENLRILDVSGASLTDASVGPVLGMELQSASISGGMLSEAARARVEAALTPHIQTEHRSASAE